MPTTSTLEPSPALEVWRRERRPQLTLVSRLAADAGDQAEADLLTRAYVLVLTAEFQGYFTDLLGHIAGMLVDSLPAEVPPPFRAVLRSALESGWIVDFRNPDATTLRRDLTRFGLEPRTLVGGPDGDGRRLLSRLDRVIAVRNKLTHGANSVAQVGAGGGRLTPTTVDEWSGDLDRLVTILDNAVALALSVHLSIGPATKELP